MLLSSDSQANLEKAKWHTETIVERRPTDGLGFFLIGFSGLMGCCLLGAIWSIVRNDVQGGTGIASCLMYFIGFAVAAVTYGA
jgi:hypothetical protein